MRQGATSGGFSNSRNGRAERLRHPNANVYGRGASEAHDHPTGSTLLRKGQELAEPITTRHERIAPAFGNQSQPETAGGLNDRDSPGSGTWRVAPFNQSSWKRPFDPGELRLDGFAEGSFYLNWFKV
jgi:hypothetical protein